MKLRKAADEKEVEKGIHILQEPIGWLVGLTESRTYSTFVKFARIEMLPCVCCYSNSEKDQGSPKAATLGSEKSGAHGGGRELITYLAFLSFHFNRQPMVFPWEFEPFRVTTLSVIVVSK